MKYWKKFAITSIMMLVVFAATVILMEFYHYKTNPNPQELRIEGTPKSRPFYIYIYYDSFYDYLTGNPRISTKPPQKPDRDFSSKALSPVPVCQGIAKTQGIGARGALSA